jgi:hypothetical protein
MVGVVVLRPEWFEPEVLRRQSERDDEAGRDKRLLHPDIFLDAAASVSEEEREFDETTLSRQPKH